MKYHNREHRQAGVGLVEIMVALVIGLFLVGGVAQIFLSNKQSFRVQEAQASLQENMRLASVLLSSGIGKAGFRENAHDGLTTVFPATTPALAGTNNEGASTIVLDGTDTITIRFQGNDMMTSCLGGTVEAGVLSANTYRVNNNRVLQCVTNNTAGGMTTTATQALLDNVEDIQILYGEDTNADGSADRYVNAATVGLNWNNVLSVHVALLLASDGDVKPDAETKIYHLVGTSITKPDTGKDRAQRRVVERVIALRNRLP